MRALPMGAALGLIATAALAQQTNPPHVDMPIGAQLNRIDTQVATPRPVTAPTPVPRDVSVTYPSEAVVAGERSPYLSDNVSGPTADARVVKSSPVPDTPAARKLYRPLSRAGQRTTPASN